MINWTLKTIPIKQLTEHPKNPRQINKDQARHLEELIKEFGLIDKPIVNTTHQIIGGHQRVKILKKMKVKEVECWVPDHELTEEEIDHLCIGLNLNQGSFDYDLLANNFNPIDLLKWGFTEQQLVGKFEGLIEEIESKEEKPGKSKQSTCPNCGHEF